MSGPGRTGQRAVSLSWWAVALAVVAIACIGIQALNAQQEDRSRALLHEELAAAAASGLEDAPARVRLARLRYQAGEFAAARDLVMPLAERPDADDDALELAARLAFLTGQYDTAEGLYDRLIAARANDLSKRVAAQVAQLFVYYQRDHFDRIAAIDLPAGVNLPNATLARAFTGRPYRLAWDSADRTTDVPFYSLDPLPQLVIEVNGVRLNAIFDTGADMLVIDDEVAARLGVTTVASAAGSFGGGLSATVGFGKVDSARLGGVSLQQVPVMTMPTKRFTFDPARPLEAIVGTGWLRQFLATVDYRSGTLKLRERTPEQRAAIRRELAGKIAAEIPFALDLTHLMYARGSLNGKDGLTYFIDSGLGMNAVMTAPIQTLVHAGIPVPETKVEEGGVGGGGGRFATGYFPIASISLGPLQQTQVRGQYGTLPPASYWARGFIVDGLVSHEFLRQYRSWTIDFDSMTYLFEAP